MADLLNAFIKSVQRRVRDLAGALADDDDYTDAVGAALEKYSVDRPPAIPTSNLHILTQTQSTIFPTDYYAVVKLAACELLRELAGKYAGTGEGAFMNASFGSFQSKSDQFAKRANELQKEYDTHIAKAEAPRGERHTAVFAGVSPDEIDSRLHPDKGRRPKVVFPSGNTWRDGDPAK